MPSAFCCQKSPLRDFFHRLHPVIFPPRNGVLPQERFSRKQTAEGKCPPPVLLFPLFPRFSARDP